MIKLRVEWRRECRGCGIELVVDFLDESTDLLACPWCGGDWRDHDVGANNGELRRHVSKAVKALEEEANGRMAVNRS